jgi:hypothetical protein
LHPIRTAGKSFIGEPIDMEYSPENKIIVKARGNQTLPIDRLMEFQGNLKRLTQKNREKLMASILEKGFIAPIFVWDDAGEYRLLDGHQRLKTLLWMREKGWDIPMLPVDIIEADDEQDAKKKLLAITSQYGEFTTDGYAEFIADIEVEDSIRLVDGDFMFRDGDIDLDFQTPEGETIDDTIDHFGITLTFPIENKDAIKRLEKKIGKAGICDIILSKAEE